MILELPFVNSSMSLRSPAFSVLLAALLVASNAFAQTSVVPITGRVLSDESNEGLPGVNVVVKGSPQGTITDADGRFSLTVSFPVTLVFSSIGYLPMEEKLEGQQEITIVLKTDVKQLQEIVVVGYGTQEKRNLVSSVSKVNAEETNRVPVSSFDMQLQGKAAGVQVNLQSGIPGDAAVLRVRGATSINASVDPLYIVDGVFVNNKSLSTVDLGGKATSPLADINPADIESIEVLKDATATAIYGSRGANGVVIITTKRGEFESAPKISFNASQGWAWAQKDRLWDLVTGEEHALLVNEQWVNSGQDNPSLNQTFENRPFRPAGEVINNRPGRGLPSEQQTYDRLADIFRTASLQNYDLSIDGGSKSTKYYIGGSYTNQEATLMPAYYQRASFKLNLDQRINDNVLIGTSNSITRSYRRQVRAGTGPNGGIFQAALHTPTYLPKTYDDGRPARWGGFDNAKSLTENLQLNTVSLRYIGNVFADFEVLPNLKFRSSWSVDYNNYKENEYNNDKTQIGAAQRGFAVVANTQNSSWINEQTLRYKKTFGTQHNFGALFGNTLQSNEIEVNRAEGSGFPNNSYTQISAASVRTATQTWSKSTLASFFSRLDYNFGDKYFIELTARADGSSKFGKNNKWGFFPSIGGAWRIKSEKFLEGVDFLDELKVRASVGVIGNQNGIDDFAALGTWSGAGGYPDGPTSGDKPGTAPNTLSNPDLKWERTQQTDLGVDVGVLDGRVTFSVDAYLKYTTDLLRPVPLPANTGYSYYMANDGEISNRGIELTLSTVNVQTEDVTWKSSFNIAANRNKVEKLATPTVAGSRDMVRAEEGYSLYSFWMYKQLYVDPETGNSVFEDVNDDGKITVLDRQILGNALPKYFGGLTNNFSYKGFDLSVFFSFEYGTKKVSFDRILMEGGGVKDANRAILAYNLKRWQKPGDHTDVPRVTSVGNNYLIEQNSRFIEDASFVRLRDVTIGYTLPERIVSRLHVKALRLYATGTNLWLLTDYMGPDPESNHTAEQNARGIDVGTPPQPQSLQLGLNITL